MIDNVIAELRGEVGALDVETMVGELRKRRNSRVEVMRRGFTKYHLTSGRGVLHRFTLPDRGDAHDHPWGFRSIVLLGGYVEEVFHVDGKQRWRSEIVHRPPRTSNVVSATHIHRIVELPAGECWTLVRAGPHERVTRFWRCDDRGAVSRAWNQRRWA